MLSMKTVVHATDFSKPAEYAFRLACSLARDHQARLVIVHVMPPPVAYDEIVLQMPPELYKEQIWDSFRTLQATEPKVRELHVETRLLEGDPAREIVSVADELAADLIVMGTHGRTGLSRLLMGSVAEQVMRKAPCPVLTVKGTRCAPEISRKGSGSAMAKA